MNVKSKILFSTFVFVLLISSVASAWSGKCVGVHDGDTILVLHGGKAEIIRLYGIECPERGQPFGESAKQFTFYIVFGKIVEVNPVIKDRSGITIAWVYANRISLNRELLRAGLARRYSNDRDLAILEEEARAKRIGLWGDPDPIPPWEWKRKKK